MSFIYVVFSGDCEFSSCHFLADIGPYKMISERSVLMATCSGKPPLPFKSALPHQSFTEEMMFDLVVELYALDFVSSVTNHEE